MIFLELNLSSFFVVFAFYLVLALPFFFIIKNLFNNYNLFQENKILKYIIALILSILTSCLLIFLLYVFRSKGIIQ